MELLLVVVVVLAVLSARDIMIRIRR